MPFRFCKPVPENPTNERLDFHCESLETRRLLAGTVRVEMTAANDIIVTGDECNNSVQVEVDENSVFLAVSDGGLLEAEQDEDFDATDVRDIRVNLGSGDDLIQLSGTGQVRDIYFDQRQENSTSRNDLELSELNARDIRVRAGDGEAIDVLMTNMSVEDVRIQGADSFARLSLFVTNVGGDIRMDGRDGMNSLLLRDFTSVSGDVRVDFGNEDDAVLIRDATISGQTRLRLADAPNKDFVSIQRSQLAQLNVNARDGESEVILQDTRVDGTLRIDQGNDRDRLTLDGLQQLSGNATFRMGNGHDIVDNPQAELGNVFAGNVTFDLGSGNNDMRLLAPNADGAFTTLGRLTINAGNGTDFVELEGGFGQARLGSLRANLRDGHDVLQLDGVRIENTARVNMGDGADFFAFVNDTLTSSTRGSVRIDTGAGDDVVEIDDIDNRDGMQINTGAGEDEVFLEDVDSSGGFGFLDIRLNTGSGNDVITAANVPIAEPLFIDGGSGTDTLFVSFGTFLFEDSVRRIEEMAFLD